MLEFSSSFDGRTSTTSCTACLLAYTERFCVLKPYLGCFPQSLYGSVCNQILRYVSDPNLVTVCAGIMLQKMMGMASAPGNIVASLGRPIHMVRVSPSSPSCISHLSLLSYANGTYSRFRMLLATAMDSSRLARMMLVSGISRKMSSSSQITIHAMHSVPCVG